MKRVFVVLMCMCLVALTHAELLIYDSFDGPAGSLNGVTPDIGSDAWAADGTYLNLDGSGKLVVSSPGWFSGQNGLLPFAPENGYIYTLSAKVDVLSGGHWLGLGFVNSADASHVNDGFVWIPAGPSIIYQDNGGDGSVKSFVWGDYAPEDDKTSADLGVDISGEVLLECVIDTTQSETSWSISTYVNGVLAMTDQWGTNPVIAGVGLGALGADGSSINATVDDFMLTREVPEPATMALLGLGGLLLRSKRR